MHKKINNIKKWRGANRVHTIWCNYWN